MKTIKPIPDSWPFNPTEEKFLKEMHREQIKSYLGDTRDVFGNERPILTPALPERTIMISTETSIAIATNLGV